ncbi:GNAT family N-acetyltransferase [Chitinophaga sp. ysch24]|uniref:GNAT family N-acetyltransferase n=2 Tax=Chitinophaga tropicalis TaxID=2683588 RepID=A0A7K1UD54_9BACT|nr:GNAT family N-acetyltransferase [Chitinophaga tropicalis]
MNMNSMNTSYRSARLTDAEELTIMSMELYNEVVNRKDFTENRIVASLRFYEENSNMGEVLMLEYNSRLAGYAIVFRFWSNEYGGLILGVDELFIRKPFRRLGIAKTFINSLISEEKNNPLFAGVEMEGHADNDVANKLYASIGVPKNNNSFYIRLFKR